MFDIGASVGKNAINGAMKRIGEVFSGVDPEKINSGLTAMAEKIPILGMFVQGYEAMSDEEKAEFAKNIMLAGAAMTAKNGGKVSF